MAMILFQNLVSYAPSLSHSSSFPLLIYLPAPLVLEEKQKRLTWQKPSAPVPLPNCGCPLCPALSRTAWEFLFLAVSCGDVAAPWPKFTSSRIIRDAERIYLHQVGSHNKPQKLFFHMQLALNLASAVLG